MILNKFQERKKMTGALCMHMFILILREAKIQSALVLVPYDQGSEINPVVEV